MKRLWRAYNLSIVLAMLFLASWALQTWLGWGEFAAEQQAHGESPEVFGPSGYIWSWGRSTFENWQSEFLQLLTFVVLTTYLVHKGSHESKDTDDKMQAQVDRIEQRLGRIESVGAGSGDGSQRGADHRRRAPEPAGKG